MDYAFLFGKIAPVVMEESSQEQNDEKKQNLSDVKIEAELAFWVKKKGFTEKGITIEQLSQKLGTNRTYLSSYINTCYKQTFSNWINNLRIEEAKYLLLKEPLLTVGQVGEKIGYTDKSNFGRQFTKRTGASPNAWRNSNRVKN